MIQMKINVYDFDDTIYDGDSTLDFFKFCLLRKKKTVLLVPVIIIYFIRYKMRTIEKEVFKEKFYSFLTNIDDVDALVALFWQANEKKIKNWYYDKRQDSDVVITASPLFLVKPMCDILGIKIIASLVDKNTGKLGSKNCHGAEKVVRFTAEYPTAIIEKFYSDSFADAPLASIAKQSYFVNKDKIVKWDEYVYKETLLEVFTDKKFIKFLLVGVINVAKGILFSYLFSMFIPVNVAFVVGYIASVTLSYVLVSYIVFKDKLSVSKYIKFMISYIPNFLIQLIFVVVLYNMLGLYELIVYAISAIIATPITYLALKYFAFK